MSMRFRKLPEGWYPTRSDNIKKMIDNWTEGVEYDEMTSAAVVPHAGWYFSGRTAAKTLKKLCSNKDVIAVIGGHLPPGNPILVASEDYFELPDNGRAKNSAGILGCLKKEISVKEDVYADNTVEVLLPMINQMAPDAEILWLRAPSDSKSIILAEKLKNIFDDQGVSGAVVGSTDLTHYGPNYGFAPMDSLNDPVSWVKNINDQRMIDAMIAMNPDNIINTALSETSACSPGAAAAAAVFAGLMNIKSGMLVDYACSYDIQPSRSFVGYAGIIY